MIDPLSLTFRWPLMLLALAVLPPLAWWLLRSRLRVPRGAAAFGAAGTDARPSGGARRWLPALLMLAGLAALLLAMGRPQALMQMPARVETVILAMDMSGSMRATDISPTRIGAAQAAARAFVAAQPQHVRVGIVAVAGTAAVVQSPTTRRDDLEAAIERLQLQRGTALGSGLLIALATLLPEARIDVEAILSGRPSAMGPRGAPRPPEGDAFKPVPPGSNTATAIVLLSDGQSNTGPDPLKIAELAAQRGVRIHAVGIGSPEGVTLSAEGWSARVRLDEATLRQLATMTAGEYFRAGNAADLKKIYRTIGKRIALEKPRPVEITALLAALGALLAIAGGLLSIAWNDRLA